MLILPPLSKAAFSNVSSRKAQWKVRIARWGLRKYNEVLHFHISMVGTNERTAKRHDLRRTENR